MPLPFQQNLAGAQWTVRPAGDLSHVPAGITGRTIAATVPGCIHTDLIDAGHIRDPRIGDAESEIQWVSWTDWRYELEFDAEPALFERDEIDLVFDHLDTIATIELNGVEIGKAASEFLPWRFSVRGVLRSGRNHLAVTFTSPLRYVKEEAARLGPRPVNGDYPAYNMIRKCASNFEWDWGPRVATCGIAGSIRIESWSGARIASIATRVHRTAPGAWILTVDIGLQYARGDNSVDNALVRVQVGRPYGAFIGRQQVVHASGGNASVQINLDGIEEWSTFTHGRQPTYVLCVHAILGPIDQSLDWHTCDQFEGYIAFRQTALQSNPDDNGSGLALEINGEPIYCRGANWIPEGLFPRDRTPERVRARLEQLKAAKMNMIRVWGGGRYEPDWFYDICDELGIMVWQDFMFACACYPEEEPIRSLVEQEARYHVARLARHPSVVLWCGGNECEWAHESWGFKEKLAPGQTWGQKYYREILPRVCAEVNPAVPHIPNSPFSPKAGLHPNDASSGDTHTWEVWGEGYRTVTPRFCSEFGQQGPSNVETLAKAGLLPDSPSLREGAGGWANELASTSTSLVSSLLAARQRGPGGNKRWYDDPIAAWFRPPRDFDEWHYLAQLVQARSLQIGIEWQRANMPRCMGSLIWQLNDAWPGLSWSLIDPDGRPKLAYHAIAAAFKNRKLTIQPLEGSPHVVAINDTAEKWSGFLRLRRVFFDGSRSVDGAAIAFTVEPRCAMALCRAEEIVGPPDAPDSELLVADSLAHRAFWYYLPDKELRYPTPETTIEFAHHHSRKASVTVASRVLLRDAVLSLAGAIDNASILAPPLFTLLPGEQIVLGVRVPDNFADTDGATQRLRSTGLIHCANRFGKPLGA